MDLSSTRPRRRAQAAVAVGGVLIIGLGGPMFLGGSSSSDISTGKDKRGSAEAFVPSTTGKVGGGGTLDESGAASGTGGLASLTGAGADDPFANTEGDKAMHRVSISFASDGAMYAGYRFRHGGEGVKVADGTLSVSRDVHGPLPVAQTAVQVLGTATYAMCTIAVDDVVVTRQTARGDNHVVVCIG